MSLEIQRSSGDCYCRRCLEPLPGPGPRECMLCGMSFAPDDASTYLVQAQIRSDRARRPWRLYSLFNALCRIMPANSAEDSITTEMSIPASPLDVWRNIQFYEEVTQPAPLVLRWLLPTPVRTEGGKQNLHAVVRCTYRGGFLIKKITDSKPGSVIEFDVLKQALGIEGFVALGRGSYRLLEDEGKTRVVLNTCYRGHLKPRALWRPFERWVAHMMHRHILDGMRIHLLAAAAPAGARSYASS